MARYGAPDRVHSKTEDNSRNSLEIGKNPRGRESAGIEARKMILIDPNSSFEPNARTTVNLSRYSQAYLMKPCSAATILEYEHENVLWG